MFKNTDSCFPGIVESDQYCFRYLDKDVTGNEEYLYSNYYREQINTYGTRILYYVNAYNVLSADNFYGEDPTRKFTGPRCVTAFIELSENADMLSKFGFRSDDAITLYIHISSYFETFYDVGIESLITQNEIAAQDECDLDHYERISSEARRAFRTEKPGTYETQFNQVQPKPGDVFLLQEYGRGRPAPRGAKHFEVTEVLDQDISKTNPLGGHYVWIIKGKRFEYSYEPGLSAEKGSDQVYDSSQNGILSGGSQTPSVQKKYDQQYPLRGVSDVSKKHIFDMPKNNPTDVYGGY